MKKEIENLVLELRANIEDRFKIIDKNSSGAEMSKKAIKENIELIAKSREDIELVRKLTKILQDEKDKESWAK